MWVKRRYSDFDSLHKQFLAIVGDPPPAPLPRKTYLISTLSNAALAEERRIELEKYVRAVAYDKDSRWRDSPAWRTFLNLPVDRTVAQTGKLFEDGQRWLEKHKKLVEILQEARMKLAKRNAASGTMLQQEAAKEARKLLALAKTNVEELERAALDMDGIGEGELRRRRDLVTHAKADLGTLERLLLNMPPLISSSNNGEEASANERKDLFDTKAGILKTSSPVSGRQGRVFGPKETDRTRALNNHGLLKLQSTVMQEQDDQLAQLERILARQKELGLQISDELQSQNDLLEEIDGGVDRTTGKIKIASKRADKLR